MCRSFFIHSGDKATEGMAEAEAAELVDVGEGRDAPDPPPSPVPPPMPPPPIPPGTKVKGVVNWFNVAKGFGACWASK